MTNVLVLIAFIGLFCGGLALWTALCEWIAEFFIELEKEVPRGRLSNARPGRKCS